jgi:8-amino-7-oxononanoate synthase
MSALRPLDASLGAEIEELERLNLRRAPRLLDGAQGPEVFFEGRRVLNFSSNDYLGLANEKFIREAAAEAARRFGAGAGAARLLSGTQPPHVALEEEIAAFKGTEAALSFSCGYTTALGVIPALVGSKDFVILDKLCHACLVDGARLSGATLRIFPHNNLERLEVLLRNCRKVAPDARILIVTESVFSMDGDTAPLTEIVALKERYGAWLYVDEAHGVGVLGESGRGLVQALSLGNLVEVQMGTLGKAIGAAGGYIAGSRTLIDFLINRARSFIFSTAPPPAQAAAAVAALRWLQTSEGKERVRALENNRRYLFAALPDFFHAFPTSAIVPLPVGDEGAAVALAQKFFEQGFFIPAVRFPTVPRGRARLRLTLTALHTTEHLNAVINAIRGLFPKS